VISGECKTSCVFSGYAPPGLRLHTPSAGSIMKLFPGLSMDIPWFNGAVLWNPLLKVKMPYFNYIPMQIEKYQRML
jgi:hypothetical protein